MVPQANLTSLDPLWTTAAVTENHGWTVFDTLFGLTDDLQVRPQMAEGHQVSDDGRTWTIRLRDGLRFHDGEPVLRAGLRGQPGALGAARHLRPGARRAWWRPGRRPTTARSASG